jgi:hypothetical protein
MATPIANRPAMLAFLAVELFLRIVDAPPNFHTGADLPTVPVAPVVTGVSALRVVPLQKMQHDGKFVAAAPVLAANFLHSLQLPRSTPR